MAAMMISLGILTPKDFVTLRRNTYWIRHWSPGNSFTYHCSMISSERILKKKEKRLEGTIPNITVINSGWQSHS